MYRIAFETQEDLLDWALQGDEQAINFCGLLGEISQTWDDLVDRDNPVSDEALSKMFWLALCVLPNHPFYREHATHLSAVLETTIFDYTAANALEQGNDHAKALAFVLRDALAAVVVYCARIVGGFEWATSVAPVVRLAVHDEPLADYLEGLADEHEEAESA